MKRKLLLSGIFGVPLIFVMILFTGCPTEDEGTTLVPGIPTNVTAAAQSSGSIAILWSAPSSGGTPSSYNI